MRKAVETIGSLVTLWYILVELISAVIAFVQVRDETLGEWKR